MQIAIGIGLFVAGLLAGFVFGAWSMLEMIDKETQKAFGVSAKVLLGKAFRKNESATSAKTDEYIMDRINDRSDIDDCR
jgi:hypothetical protein